MASFDLAGFTAATKEIVERETAEATQILRDAIVDGFRNVMENSPQAKNYEGFNRYRASNKIANGPAQGQDGAPAGQASYDEPDISEAQAIAAETDLGELVSYWNDVGYDNSHKPKSYAYFIEYGYDEKDGKHHDGLFVYQHAEEATELHLQLAVNRFNAKVIE